MVAVLRRGFMISWDRSGFLPRSVEEILYPKTVKRSVGNEIPEQHRKDFIEACAVLPFSSQASAALSRRILQHILHDVYHINRNSLAQEIDEFIRQPAIPSLLAQAVDAVRTIGNFA